MKTVQAMTTILALIIGLGLSAPSQSVQPAPFTQAELDQMLAPVALYPDTVLSHVLIAATYPLEVVQAARWSRHNPSLRGEEAVAAVEYQDWDPSVKALVAFPDLLARMDEDLDWTQRLGDAFLMQEEQVVDTIQYLRSEAYAHGHLRSNEHIRVVRETQYIYIEPARTRVVYVPYYDPRVVYTRWRWASHPPVYWHHPPAYRSSVVFYWGPAYRVAPAFYFSAFHWSRRQVVSVHHHHHHYHYHRHVHSHRHFSSGREIARHSSARHWQHDPVHRRGVSYRPGMDQRRFVQSQRDSAASASVRSASARATGPQRARTLGQQRQWADQQRSAAPLRERAQTHSQTQGRSSGASPLQRGDAGRTSGHRGVVQRSGNQVQNRARESSPARAASSRLDSGARSTPRTNSTPSRETARPQARAPRAAASSSPRPAGTVSTTSQTRSAAAPSRSQSSRSATPTRSSTTPARSSSSHSAAPRSSSSSTRSTTRAATATRGSNPQRSSHRPERRID
jgi:hypothetical protein